METTCLNQIVKTHQFLQGFKPRHLHCYTEGAEENHVFGYDLMRRVSRVMLERLQATRRKLTEFYCTAE